MRETVEEYEYNGAAIRIEVDTGGPVGGERVVLIDGEGYRLERWFYFDEYDAESARSFAETVVDNDAFRGASQEGTADWKQVSQLYQPAAHRITEIFEDAELLSYEVGEEQEEATYHKARAEREALCEEIFYEIRDRIRTERGLNGLDAFIDARVERAQQTAEALAE